MNSRNRKTLDPNRLLLNLSENINFRSYKYFAVPNLSLYHTWKHIKNSYQNKKFKIY